ncbi:MAG: sugar phosphate isomerase/epimerase [Phycisphaeraceae bacterium]|nr:sugar phosphate isomerase/epimerase [Phycisphaerae bacterium]MBX3391683.1 sugar phosphate isomerase/epimerase [Phycisphaeraceae bacterium]
MPRPVTLFTGQWADLPLESLAATARSFGYDGLELACWGDHVDVAKADTDDAYAASRRQLLQKHGLSLHAISAHLVGQAVCDRIDHRHKAILPERVWGDGEPEGVRRRAADEMKATARAARRIGVSVVNGFTGSSTWGMLYFFPPTTPGDVKAGYDDFASRWGPILDEFKSQGVRFALEVHPGEIAYDLYTAEAALSAVGHHPAFGFNFDPSHLLWQGVAPNKFIERFPDRIFHVHMKDVAVHYGASSGDGLGGVLGSHLPFGDARRGWDFRSVGRGHVNFEAIIRSLNRIDYRGPLSVEWEDPGMDRNHGARESCEFVRRLDFAPAGTAFDAAFERKS